MILQVPAMTILTDLTLAEARAGLRKADFTAVELTRAFLDRMAETRDLNAFITETPERALADAARSDAKLRAGTARPLEGLPLAVKDNYCTEGVLTTAGSHILNNFVQSWLWKSEQRDKWSFCLKAARMC